MVSPLPEQVGVSGFLPPLGPFTCVGAPLPEQVCGELGAPLPEHVCGELGAPLPEHVCGELDACAGECNVVPLPEQVSVMWSLCLSRWM